MIEFLRVLSAIIGTILGWIFLGCLILLTLGVLMGGMWIGGHLLTAFVTFIF